MSVSSIGNLFSLFTPTKPPPPKSPSFQFSPTSSSRPYNRLAVVSSSDVRSVVWPSVAYVNTLYFRSAYNVQVIVDDNEPEEKLLGRFRREVMRAGVIQECKRRTKISASPVRLLAAIAEDVAHHHQEISVRISKRQPRARGMMMMTITGNFLMEVSPIETNFQIFFFFGFW